ncbi:pyruvate kinase [bacterium]|nr:pyruvate kinase [bacterium]
MERTKMIFTLGPATDRPGVLKKLIRAGMDCARFNFSHGEYPEHAKRFALLERESRAAGVPVATLLDLTGPKLRVGKFKSGGISLLTGAVVRIRPGKTSGSRDLIPVNYVHLSQEVKRGDAILMDDGLIRLKVMHKEGRDVICKVVVGGILKDKKGLNLPGQSLRVPAMTAKDKRDLAFGLQLGFDYVALSFVRKSEEMRVLKKRIRAAGSQAGTIAKIEKPQAIPHLEKIIQVSDGVMIARGDLGVEMSAEQVPVLQKKIISMANHYGKVVITATQMLQSMMENPTPTRAEASDVANAIFDGSDGIMLSGETAAGRYPVQSATMMARIAAQAEAAPEYNRLSLEPTCLAPEDDVIAAGVHLVEKIKARYLVVFTQTGNTARLISRQRPQVPVIALAHSEVIRRKLALVWGVESLLINTQPALETIVEQAVKVLLACRRVRKGDWVVILASSPRGTRTNFIKIHQIGEEHQD